MGGDLYEQSVLQSQANVAYTRQHQKQQQLPLPSSSSPPPLSSASCQRQTLKSNFHVEILRWNAGRLPLRDASVDLIICDMPFGMRHGNYRENRQLYPIFFKEALRILTKNGKVYNFYYLFVNLFYA